MIFIFKKKEILIDAFTNNQCAFTNFAIERALKFIPEWWKNLPPEIVKENVPNGTMKICSGFIDLYKTGFIIPIHSDLILETSGSGDWQVKAPIAIEFGEHGRFQYGTAFDNHINLKYVTPWLLREKTGVQFLFTNPMWNNISYWNSLHVVPGITDFKTSSSSNINVFVNKINQVIHINAGTPLAHVIPLSDKKLKIKCHLVDQKEYDRLDINLSYFSFTNKRKEFKKLLEKRESESKCPFGFK
jgi:hypothetical protein